MRSGPRTEDDQSRALSRQANSDEDHSGPTVHIREHVLVLDLDLLVHRLDKIAYGNETSQFIAVKDGELTDSVLAHPVHDLLD